MAISSADPNAYLAIGMQSGLGTPQTGVTKLRFAKYLSGTNFQAEPDIQFLREGGDGLDWGFGYKRGQKVSGQIVVNLRPEVGGQLLQLMPAGATWDGGSQPAVHTFHTGHASFPWSTVYIQHPGSTMVHQISDCLFTGFTLEGQSGEPVKLTLPFIGIQHNINASSTFTPSYVAEDPFVFHFNPSYRVDGTGDSAINSWKVEAGLGIEELQAQSFLLDDIAVQNRDFSVEVTRRYQNPTQWGKIMMGGGVAPTNTVPTGGLRFFNTYGSGANLKSFDVNVPLVAYDNDSLSELDPDGKTVYETITGKGLKGATSAMIAVLKNVHASAYSS